MLQNRWKRERTRPCPTLPSPFKWRHPSVCFHSARYTHGHVTNGCHIRSRYYDLIRSGNKRKDAANTRRPSSQLEDKHGCSCMGRKKKKEKKFHSVGKKFRSDLKSKKLKILKRFKTKENRIVTPGLYCLLKGWKKKIVDGRAERQRRNDLTKTRTGNPWITNDEFIFVGTKSYATVDDFEGLENSFRIPGGPLNRMLKLHPRLFNPPRLSRFRRKYYIYPPGGDWPTLIFHFRNPPLHHSFHSFLLFHARLVLEINPTNLAALFSPRRFN